MNRPLRICHLGKYYHPTVGGIETELKNLVESEAQEGHQVEVICLQNPGKKTTVETVKNIKITKVGRLARIASLDISPELIEILNRTEADIFHLHVPNPTMILGMLFSGRFLKSKTIVTYHSDHVAQPIRGALIRPLEHLFYQTVSGIVATSQDYLTSSNLLCYYRKISRVIPLGMNLKPFLSPTEQERKQAAQIKASFDGPLWLVCGRLVPYKGIETAIKAMHDLPGTLLIVGDGPERDSLQKLAKDFRVRSQVVFMGQTPTTIPYYLAAHAFWLTSKSRNEAFGMVQIEAMASGLPVINPVIEGSGCHRVSLDGVTGFSIPHSDTDALVEASRKLMDRKLHAQFSENAVRRAKAEFTNHLRFERYLDLYREVLSTGNESEVKWAANS